MAGFFLENSEIAATVPALRPTRLDSQSTLPRPTHMEAVMETRLDQLATERSLNASRQLDSMSTWQIQHLMN